MSVKSPRAYAAYARDVPTGGGPACSGSAPDSRPLRARVAVRLRLLVRLGELPHHLLTPLVQSLEPPLLSFGERVRGNVHPDGRVPRGRGVDRHGALVRHAEHRFPRDPQGLLALEDVAAQ